MNRLTEIEIAGSTYPLNFSIKAINAMTERYGDIAEVETTLKNKSMSELMDEVLWQLELFIDQGIEYKRIVEGTEQEKVSMEHLQVLISIYDLPYIKEKLMEARTSGTKREIEVEADPKNESATQDS